jgi:hypothetical protein
MPDSGYATAEATIQQQRATAPPAFQFSVLTCLGRLLATKIFNAEGHEILPDKRPANFRYKSCELDTLEECVHAFKWLAGQPQRFIIRGSLRSDLDPLKPHPRWWAASRLNPPTITCGARCWIGIDVDDTPVPHGLGKGDKLAEAGYYVRDQVLGAPFCGVRCVVAATASTGRKGPEVARLRLFFALTEALNNDVICTWLDHLHDQIPAVDPSIGRAGQPIFTARPIFRGGTDPVPEWGRVRLLDGSEDAVVPPTLNAAARKRKQQQPGWHPSLPAPDWARDLSAEYLDLCEQYAGRGVCPIDTSEKARRTIRQVFEMLQGCPTGHDDGRHKTLTKGAWLLGCMVSEGEMGLRKALRAYLSAAAGINNKDKKYDREAVKRRCRDAFADVWGR